MISGGFNQETEGIILKIHQTTNNALILKVITADYSLLTVYAPYAKNSKKRYGQLDLFDWGLFTIKENQLGLYGLHEFSAKSSFPGVRNSLDKIIVVSCVAEILEQIIPENDPSSLPSFITVKDYLLSLERLTELTEILKLTHLCLLELLVDAGIVEREELATPNGKNLIRMIMETERYLGKQLKLKFEIEKLIQELKRSQGSDLT